MAMWRWVLGASVVGAAAVAVACSSSSGGPSGTPGDDGGSDGASDDGGGMTCTPVSTLNAATIDAGAGWGCLQTACSASLTACGADCLCNNAIINGLLCVEDAGATSAADQAMALTKCLTGTIGPIYGTNMAAMNAGTCLSGMGKTACSPPSTDGGEGGTTPSDAGDGGNTAADASDSGNTTSDGGDEGGSNTEASTPEASTTDASDAGDQ